MEKITLRNQISEVIQGGVPAEWFVVCPKDPGAIPNPQDRLCINNVICYFDRLASELLVGFRSYSQPLPLTFWHRSFTLNFSTPCM